MSDRTVVGSLSRGSGMGLIGSPVPAHVHDLYGSEPGLPYIHSIYIYTVIYLFVHSFIYLCVCLFVIYLCG